MDTHKDNTDKLGLLFRSLDNIPGPEGMNSRIMDMVKEKVRTKERNSEIRQILALGLSAALILFITVLGIIWYTDTRRLQAGLSETPTVNFPDYNSTVERSIEFSRSLGGKVQDGFSNISSQTTEIFHSISDIFSGSSLTYISFTLIICLLLGLDNRLRAHFSKKRNAEQHK